MTPKPVHRTLRALAALAFLTLVALAAAGCSSTPTGVAALAGRYELRSVDGRSLPDDRLGGAIAGELQLWGSGHANSGQARRVVLYATSGIPGPIVVRGSGPYRVRGAEITFDLDQELRPSGTRQWRVRGEVQQGSIVLRYPNPADGTIVERYDRVP